MFLGSIKAPVPPSRPAIRKADARRRGQIRRLGGGTTATRNPLAGEHGEDPQFDAAEHAARLRQRRGDYSVTSQCRSITPRGEAFGLDLEDGELVHRHLSVRAGRLGSLRARCGIDRAQRRGQRLAVLPTGVVRPVADQVGAGLRRGRRNTAASASGSFQLA
jgi:hypothetical protein